MKKKFIPDEREILDFIKKNPGCSREQLRDIFYKKGIEKNRIFSTKLAGVLISLKKQGSIIETDMIRGSGVSIANSKLYISENNKIKNQNEKKIHFKMKKAEKKEFQNEKIENPSLKDIDEKILKNLDIEKSLSNIEMSLKIPIPTLFKHLKRLESLGFVTKNPKNKYWKLTSHGEKKVESEMIEKYSPDDGLFFHLPFLIHSGERFGVDDLVERTNSFYGFYFKHGLSQDDAAKDFKNKLEKTLNSQLVAPYIQKIRYKYEVVCSEEKLLLWRLYSMLNTVLYKSEKERIGFGTILYDQLIYLLKDKFGSIDAKIKDLEEYEQYWIWLMYNGVQLETILPKMEIIDGDGYDLRDELEKRGIPIKIYNKGKDDETTLIEMNTKNKEIKEELSFRP